MTSKGLMADRSYWNKFMVLVSLILIWTVLLTAIGFLIGYFGYGIDLRQANATSDLTDPNVMSLLKTLQILTQFGMFVFPSIIMAWLVSGTVFKWFKMDKNPGLIPILSCILIMLCSTPFVNWMVMLNEGMTFPSSLEFLETYMKEMEQTAADLTDAFLDVVTIKGVLLNLFMIAIIPAIGEELLFRGIIQRWLGEWLDNPHVAIVIAAAIFSAVHFQFYGFIPRMVFGILFGYMYLWSGSLWLPIIAHLTNNTTAVILSYYSNSGKLPFDQDEIGTGQNDTFLLIASVTVVFLLALFLKRYLANNKPLET